MLVVVRNRGVKRACKSLSVARWYSVKNSLRVDDVSRLNSTPVSNIYKPINIDDIKIIIERAKENKKQISVKGTSHSMGGHSIAKDGYIIDTIYMNKMQYDKATNTVTVGPGATWGDLILYLNQFGMSPQIMQSYCSFSIGGTISVNAHGITSDYALYESVVRLKVITSNGDVVSCSRTNNRELFSGVIGGYGLFGVIADITLKVVPNSKVALSFSSLDREVFPMHFSRLMHDKSVEVKLGRINIVQADQINLFAFRRMYDSPTVSDIEGAPRGMTISAQLLYKWLMPLKFMKKN